MQPVIQKTTSVAPSPYSTLEMDRWTQPTEMIYLCNSHLLEEVTGARGVHGSSKTKQLASRGQKLGKTQAPCLLGLGPEFMTHAPVP